MAEKFPLNDLLSPLDRNERLKVQENWMRIKTYLNSLQSQILMLAGDTEIDKLFEQINGPIESSEMARSNAENSRANAETARANAEIARVNAEAQRVIIAQQLEETERKLDSSFGKLSTDFENWTDLATYLKNNVIAHSTDHDKGNVKIVIPAGTYVITDVNVFNNFTKRTNGLSICGAGKELTRIIFNPAQNNQYLFKNDDKLLVVTFEDLSFIGNMEKNPSFMLSISHGGAQNYTFNRVGFCNWDKVIDMQGTNNNSEFSFYTCEFTGIIKSGVLYVGDTNTSQDSDQFLNYDFFACKFEVEYGNFINMKYGGNINIYGGSYIHIEYDSANARGGTFFNLRSASHNLGVCRLMVMGARFEFRNRNSKLIQSEWTHGNIEFLNCDMDCYSMIDASKNWITAIFTGINTFPVIKFDNCSLLGKHHYRYNTENYQYQNSIVYTSCHHTLLSHVNELFTFSTYPEENFFNHGSAPAIKVENFKGSSQAPYDTVINGLLHSGAVLNKKLLSLKTAQGGFPSNGGMVGVSLPLGSIITSIRLYCPPNATSSASEVEFVLRTNSLEDENYEPVVLASTSTEGPVPYHEGFDIQSYGSFVCDTEENRTLVLEDVAGVDQATHLGVCLIEYI